MAIKSTIDYFTKKNITPSNLQQDMLVSFNYKSPNGVTDKNPLVYVLEKRNDRFFGINLHYDMSIMTDLVVEQNDKINMFLESEWYKKFPEKKKEIIENDEEFDVSMIDPKVLADIKRRFKTSDLEKFFIDSYPDNLLRNYLYKRMTMVSKLVYKI